MSESVNDETRQQLLWTKRDDRHRATGHEGREYMVLHLGAVDPPWVASAILTVERDGQNYYQDVREPRKTSHEVKSQAASLRGGGNARCSS